MKKMKKISLCKKCWFKAKKWKMKKTKKSKEGMKQNNAKKFMQFLSIHHYDSDAIRFDLAQRGLFNKMDQSILYNALNKNKYFVKVIRKYANLKDELLKNDICAMDIKLFHRQRSKAHIFASSEKGKKSKAKDIGIENNELEVSPFCPISVAHILCALTYCNCTNQRFEFKKYGTRNHKNGQKFEELKQLNAEISHWYSLLHECVWFFGSETTPHDIFYTGLNIPLLFDSFAPKFTAPISTTVDLNIATSFSKGTGVILKMEQGKGFPANYFNVEWLSNFDSERERLFFCVDNLRILDVQTWHNGKKFVNDEYIKAMTLFSSLFAGHYLLDLLNKKTQKILTALIQCFNANNNLKSNGQITKNQFSLFMEQIFFNLVHKMDKMIVIKQEYEKLSDELKFLLFTFISNRNDISTSPFFEHLKKTNGKNIAFMDEYVWTLDVEQMEALKYGQKDVFIYSDSFYFYSSNDQMIEFKVGLRNEAFSKYTAFILEIIKTPMSNYQNSFVDPLSLDGCFSIYLNSYFVLKINVWRKYRIH